LKSFEKHDSIIEFISSVILFLFVHLLSRPASKMVQTRRMKATTGSELVVEAEIQLKLANTFTIKKEGRSYAQQCEDLRGLQDASIYDAAFPKVSAVFWLSVTIPSC
jgi:hypothetical protein